MLEKPAKQSSEKFDLKCAPEQIGTRWERLKSAPYPRLKLFKICSGRFYENSQKSFETLKRPNWRAFPLTSFL